MEETPGSGVVSLGLGVCKGAHRTLIRGLDGHTGLRNLFLRIRTHKPSATQMSGPLAPCAPRAAHTTRRESLASLSRRRDVSDVADSLGSDLGSAPVAPGLPFPRLRGRRRFVFSAGGDVH